MLENFGVTEANWRDALKERPGFGISESPTYVARGVAALARAADVDRWAGTIISARQLADAYGVTDTDGSRPDCWGYLAAYGWRRTTSGHRPFSLTASRPLVTPFALRDIPEHCPPTFSP